MIFLSCVCVWCVCVVCVLVCISACACLHIIESIFRDHSRAMEDECVNDDEESLIQSFMSEEIKGPPHSLCYSSRADHSATITYTT